MVKELATPISKRNVLGGERNRLPKTGQTLMKGDKKLTAMGSLASYGFSIIEKVFVPTRETGIEIFSL